MMTHDEFTQYKPPVLSFVDHSFDSLGPWHFTLDDMFDEIGVALTEHSIFPDQCEGDSDDENEHFCYELFKITGPDDIHSFEGCYSIEYFKGRIMIHKFDNAGNILNTLIDTSSFDEFVMWLDQHSNELV
jgi:hypothetical protein